MDGISSPTQYYVPPIKVFALTWTPYHRSDSDYSLLVHLSTMLDFFAPMHLIRASGVSESHQHC